jgi:hypothetical protein
MIGGVEEFCHMCSSLDERFPFVSMQFSASLSFPGELIILTVEFSDGATELREVFFLLGGRVGDSLS